MVPNAPARDIRPGSAARNAARAIESNHIGAVIVQERGRVVGIVTDRDVTTRVVGARLDPKVTTLGSVMMSPVATLPPSATQADALLLMQQRKRPPRSAGGSGAAELLLR